MSALLFYAGFRLAMALVGILPGRWARTLGSGAGMLAYYLAPGRRRMVHRHVRRVQGADADLHREGRRVFAAYGRYWAEVLWVRPRRLARLEATTRVEGIEWLRGAVAEGRGVVAAVPHLGNWEVAGLVGIRERLRLVAVAENLQNRRVRDWFIRLRNALGIEVMLTGGGTTLMRRLEEVLVGNGVVALLCDRDLKGKGVAVRFFGEETTLPAGPVSLALRTGAALLPVGVYFDGPDGHRVVVRPPLQLPEEGDRSQRLAEGTQLLAEALEDLIRRAPDQWHLLQPNWPSDRQAEAESAYA